MYQLQLLFRLDFETNFKDHCFRWQKTECSAFLYVSQQYLKIGKASLGVMCTQRIV